MIVMLAFIVAFCAAICAVFFTRVLFLGPKMALLVGVPLTGALMYWGVLGVVAGFDTSLEQGLRVTGIYWLYSCIVWVPVYLVMLYFLLPKPGTGKRDEQ